MLSRSVDVLPTGAPWAYEPKLDGFRCVLSTTEFTHRALPAPVRFTGEVIEGGAKPVGGDDDPSIQLIDRGKDEEEAREIVATLERASPPGPAGQPT